MHFLKRCFSLSAKRCDMEVMMEIERKWMVSAWPPAQLNLPLLYEQSMRQGYINVRPTVRIREEAMTGGGTEYILCFKSGTGLVRKEIEMDIPADRFRELEDLIGSGFIGKGVRSHARHGPDRFDRTGQAGP
jgi:CYTH domain-containing protein